MAEAVAAWINIHRRIWAFDGDCAYWHNNTLVLVTIGEDMLAGRAYDPERIAPDATGRYPIPLGDWTRAPAPPTPQPLPA